MIYNILDLKEIQNEAKAKRTAHKLSPETRKICIELLKRTKNKRAWSPRPLGDNWRVALNLIDLAILELSSEDE